MKYCKIGRLFYDLCINLVVLCFNGFIFYKRGCCMRLFRWIKRLFKRKKPTPVTPVVVVEVDNGLVCPEQYVKHYKTLWVSSYVTKKIPKIIKKIHDNESRYFRAEGLTGVPWYVVACIHNMECSQRFDRNQLNGQRLDRVTTWVPKGYGPWENWEASCVDAFKIKKLPTDWNLVNTLYFLEAYNGTGYLRFHKDVNSPYLWSFTSAYTRGKYVSDGKWSHTAVSKQAGCVAILRGLDIKLK